MRLSNLASICSPSTFFTDSGDDIRILYQGVRESPSAPLILVPSGKLSISEYINSFGCSTDMAYILSRLKAGDDSVLFADNSGFGDCTAFPSNPAEGLQFVNRAISYFDNLPSGIRSRFDNDFYKWISTAGTESWISNMVSSLDSSGSSASSASSDVDTSDT